MGDTSINSEEFCHCQWKPFHLEHSEKEASPVVYTFVEIEHLAFYCLVSSAEDERVLNKATTSTIVSFKADELKVKSDLGETSTFVRL